MCWGEWSRYELCQVLFADDTALVVDAEDKLQKLVEEFGRLCERKKLTINMNKSKVMRCSHQIRERRLDVSLTWKMLEKVKHFKYLGLQIGRGGGKEVDVSFRVGKLGGSTGTFKKFVKEWRSGNRG